MDSFPKSFWQLLLHARGEPELTIKRSGPDSRCYLLKSNVGEARWSSRSYTSVNEITIQSCSQENENVMAMTCVQLLK